MLIRQRVGRILIEVQLTLAIGRKRKEIVIGVLRAKSRAFRRDGATAKGKIDLGAAGKERRSNPRELVESLIN